MEFRTRTASTFHPYPNSQPPLKHNKRSPSPTIRQTAALFSPYLFTTLSDSCASLQRERKSPRHHNKTSVITTYDSKNGTYLVLVRQQQPQTYSSSAKDGKARHAQLVRACVRACVRAPPQSVRACMGGATTYPQYCTGLYCTYLGTAASRVHDLPTLAGRLLTSYSISRLP